MHLGDREWACRAVYHPHGRFPSANRLGELAQLGEASREVATGLRSGIGLAAGALADTIVVEDREGLAEERDRLPVVAQDVMSHPECEARGGLQARVFELGGESEGLLEIID